MNNADPDTQPDSGTPLSAAELAILQAQFPCFRIWRERTCDRVRYVARSLHHGLNPHTVVTDDIGELRAALESARCEHPAARG